MSCWPNWGTGVSWEDGRSARPGRKGHASVIFQKLFICVRQMFSSNCRFAGQSIYCGLLYSRTISWQNDKGFALKCSEFTVFKILFLKILFLLRVLDMQLSSTSKILWFKKSLQTNQKQKQIKMCVFVFWTILIVFFYSQRHHSPFPKNHSQRYDHRCLSTFVVPKGHDCEVEHWKKTSAF